MHNDNYKLLIIPNVFTINNDGLNDAFDIDIHGQQYYYLTIYNRWGMKVFESDHDGVGNDPANWNGKLMNNGSDCPEGVYYLRFQYAFRGEETKTFTGVVTLVR